MNPGASSPHPPEGWRLSAEGIAYPPEPWRLEGSLHASAWLVPTRSIAGLLPDGATPVALGGRALVLTGWAVYTPGGVLEYRELLCAVPVRSPAGPGVSITHIWVDHPSAMAGGQELWGIPKHLAQFVNMAPDGSAGEARDGNGPVAAFAFGKALSLPGTWRIPLRAVQALQGGIKATRLHAAGRVSLGRGVWRFGEASPLAFLRGHRPILTARLGPMAASFGIRDKGSEGRAETGHQGGETMRAALRR